MLLPTLATVEASAADQRLSHMAALYEQVCLKAFPDDKAVDALMTEKNARPLSTEEVKVTMRNDPARAWQLAQEDGATVWLEFPPFHACSVRWNTSQMVNLHRYGAVAERYESAKSGFHPIAPFDADYGDIHAHAVGEQRILPDGSSESLLVFDQHISDPKRRAAGETGYVLRFVHQFAAPAQSSAQSWPQDRERFISITQKLQEAPLDPMLRADRQWATQWLVEAPDVSVNACLSPLGGSYLAKYSHSDEIIAQYTFAMAALIIQHPEAANDPQAQQLAGVEGALSAYRSILRGDPKVKSAALDKLLKIQERGELPGFVRSSLSRCYTGKGEKVRLR